MESMYRQNSTVVVYLVVFGKYGGKDPLHQTQRTHQVPGTPGQSAKAAFSSQTGTAYATIPGRASGAARRSNYDGKTNITSQSTTTSARCHRVGRAQSWTRWTFPRHRRADPLLTATWPSRWRVLGQWWTRILCFRSSRVRSMTGADNLKFVGGHTHDITRQAARTATATPSISAGADYPNTPSRGPAAIRRPSLPWRLRIDRCHQPGKLEFPGLPQATDANGGHVTRALVHWMTGAD